MIAQSLWAAEKHETETHAYANGFRRQENDMRYQRDAALFKQRGFSTKPAYFLPGLYASVSRCQTLSSSMFHLDGPAAFMNDPGR